MNVSAVFPRPVLLGVVATVAILAAVGIAASAGLILGNASTSVPRGLYRKAGPDAATYVTFCLGARHRSAAWYRHFCSPDDPDGLWILKRVAEIREGHVKVEGDGPRPLDSRVLGPIRAEEIRGWWRPVIQLGTRSDDG